MNTLQQAMQAADKHWEDLERKLLLSQIEHLLDEGLGRKVKRWVRYIRKERRG